MNHKTRKIKKLQTAEKSRGWLEMGRFLDQNDRVDANYFLKKNSNGRASEQANQTIETNQTNSKKKKRNISFMKTFNVILNDNSGRGLGGPAETIENDTIFDRFGAVFDHFGAVFDRLGAVLARKRR